MKDEHGSNKVNQWASMIAGPLMVAGAAYLLNENIPNEFTDSAGITTKFLTEEEIKRRNNTNPRPKIEDLIRDRISDRELINHVFAVGERWLPKSEIFHTESNHDGFSLKEQVLLLQKARVYKADNAEYWILYQIARDIFLESYGEQFTHDLNTNPADTILAALEPIEAVSAKYKVAGIDLVQLKCMREKLEELKELGKPISFEDIAGIELPSSNGGTATVVKVLNSFAHLLMISSDDGKYILHELKLIEKNRKIGDDSRISAGLALSVIASAIESGIRPVLERTMPTIEAAVSNGQKQWARDRRAEARRPGKPPIVQSR